MANINELIAGSGPPNLLGQFVGGAQAGQEFGANRQTQQQQSRLQELLAGQASAITELPGSKGAGATDADRLSAQSLAAAGDAAGLAKLQETISTRKTKGSKETFDRENKLRKQFDTQSKDFIKIRDAHTRVIKAAEDPSAAGDLALIFNYMKVLDPGSTVREGEFATAQNSGSVPSRLIAQYNQVKAGTRLAPEQRSDFLDRSGRLFEGQQSNQQELEGKFEAIAGRSDANPENVVFEYRLPDGSAQKKRAVTLTEDDFKDMSIEDLEDFVQNAQEQGL